MNERGLPKNVHLLTFRDTGDKSFLVRLAHLFEVKGGGIPGSKGVQSSYFCALHVEHVRMSCHGTAVIGVKRTPGQHSEAWEVSASIAGSQLHVEVELSI